MRIDKYICKSTELSRNEAKRLLRFRHVEVDGEVITASATKINPESIVKIKGNAISLIGTRYIMLHKPEEMICSNQDELYPSILNLIDIEKAFELTIAGRLDADTTGLVLLTDDGKWAHKITSPKRHCKKVYRAILAQDITDEMINALTDGVELHNDGLTKPAQVEVVDNRQVLLTISEGKYHQVKRMFAAVGNKVLELHRQQIGEICLDENLPEGQWRYLTQYEVDSIA